MQKKRDREDRTDAIRRAYEGSAEDRRQDAAGIKKMAAERSAKKKNGDASGGDGKCRCGMKLDKAGRCPGCGNKPGACKCKGK